MPLREATRASLVDQIIAEMQRLIESGEWPVGTKIPTEPELVAGFGVGRNTVREAVRALGHAGLLEVRPGHGTYVRADSELGAALQRRLRRAAAHEAVEVRRSCERLAARLAAERRTEEDLEAIAAALAGKQRADAGGDALARIEADIAFHLAVVAASHNSVLIDLYDNLVEALRSTVAATMSVSGADAPDSFSHAGLADAIRRGDPRAAEQAVDEHIAALQRTLADPAP